MAGALVRRFLHRAGLRRWRALAERARTADLAELRDLRAEARQTRRAVERAIGTADERLALPLLGSNALRPPPGSDWVWRPALWRAARSPSGIAPARGEEAIDAEVTLFHDAGAGEVVLRQGRNDRPQDLAPFGLALEVFGFDGRFLSLSVRLPEAAVTGLRLSHLFRVAAAVESEHPLTSTVRLNVRHGPNTAEMIAELAPDGGERAAEFDLAQAGISERRIERAWIDLIFLAPAMNRIDIRDLTLSRRPRAEL
jgi:hypothetical protein